ncbi:uncharacterized protein CTHT_0049820 [Thermochaetoides thermophila DSM 1495]|uniref:DUF1996 domain-containing protein n=1 Tax=Chaetomium thermophilum (strain DSM 1495 / CBS 144.50 / IMI 039719) TaxID=759272 RepID=G0SBD0_CHATD|nr:hypothetical protein CTHT_0049820 [Thermochaetoides thermophila DSM 1495]EGS19510.1 hypothetical protein CTHT_0049820 [Thermochaetoides thermophila DSM 1495]
MKYLPLALAFTTPAHAALRFGCATVSIQRLDPLVEPGRIPSAHLHQIVGGNAFNATMEGDIAEKATCTTCTFSENFSNYWTAVMFFKHPNGTYKRVPIMQNTALPNGINGGMTIYYTQHDFVSNGKEKITAFRPGFRMTVGSPTYNVQPGGRGNPGLRFVCLENKGTRFPELATFPSRPCRGGIMTVHHFPACWDGKNLDSPDHQSHMYNTVREAFTPAGPCPASHPVRVPQLAFETLWDTTEFNQWWPEDGSQPFVLSYGDGGDSLGYGTHADYVFGWKGDALQRAMDSDCMFQGCENGRPLKSQSVAQMNACRVKDFVGEDIDSWLKYLPGQDPEKL